MMIMRRILAPVSLLLVLFLAACGNGTNTIKAPFDAAFIDGMIEHHQGAVDMAKQAQTQAEHSELKTLADAIISDQQSEITSMQTWRKQWYPDLPPTDGTGMHMGDMEISEDTSKPFDQRFLVAMISHHQGAIDMANEASQKAEHAEIKQLAKDIVVAQTAEIQQMNQWHLQWYGPLTPTPTHTGH